MNGAFEIMTEIHGSVSIQLEPSRAVTLSFTYLLAFSKGVYSGRKKFAPLEANSFF